MSTNRLLLLMVLALLAARPVHAQVDATDASQFRLADTVLQDQDEAEPTLPEIEVFPPDNYDYTPGDAYPDGSIPWSSNSIYSDTQLVGPYGQPVWTTQRPFATSRVYVLPPGVVELSQWVRPTWPRGEKAKFRFLEEFAIGLPGRFQLDLYERWNVERNAQEDAEANHEGVQIELRYALADWGVLPLNPTLYAEWVEKGGPQDKPNVYELKLLLGDEIACNWYYASNFVLEQEVSGEREQELGWSNALSTTIIERKLLAGLEMNLTSTTVENARSDSEVSFTIGPSLQLRPTNRTFLDVVGLFGTTEESPTAQMYVIFGFQFGSRAGPAENYSGPASTRGN